MPVLQKRRGGVTHIDPSRKVYPRQLRAPAGPEQNHTASRQGQYDDHEKTGARAPRYPSSRTNPEAEYDNEAPFRSDLSGWMGRLVCCC